MVPYFFGSPTLTSAAAALSAGNTIIQRVLGTTETLRLGTLGSPALEVGDAVMIIKEPTQTDSGFSATHLIDNYTLDLVTGAVDVDTRISLKAEVEEEV